MLSVRLPPFIIIIVILVLLILTAVIGFWKFTFTYWKKRKCNFLEPTIPFGNAQNFFLGKRGFGELFGDWYLEMKAKGWDMGGAYFTRRPVFIPIDNQLIKRILVTDFAYFKNHGLYINEKIYPLSGHLFNLENRKWKNLRSKMPAAFSSSKLKNYTVIMANFTEVLVNRLRNMSQSKLPIEIKEVLSKFNVDAISACLFGIDTKSLDNENVELMKHGRAFFDIQFCRVVNTLVLLIPRPILTFFKFRVFPTHVTKYFMNFFSDIKAQRAGENIKRNDLTDILINLCDKTKSVSDIGGDGVMEPLTSTEFVAQMHLFFEAGFETTGSTQTFALYELATNPDIQNRLRVEINTVLNKFNGTVGYDAITEMKYLDQVINETLRKYPVFPILPRLCENNYRIPNSNVTIEKGTLVMVTNLGIHYDPEYYPDPMRFDPERFTSENKAKRPFCSFMPFGEGQRSCVGKLLGILQSKVGLISILRNFKVTLSEKTKVPFSFDKSGVILNTNGKLSISLETIE
uniref:Cytochrome P450 n=1 Tax=Dendroctonus ponderosae TaxID=77166 RepID=A0AAR5Q4F4_DENPD